MTDRIGVLDGLRGIAMLHTFWFHLWVVARITAPFPWLDFIPLSGAIGLFLFFFLSGLLIVFPFVRAQYAGQPEPEWSHFAWRRFIKVVPSYTLSIVVAYAIGFAVTERSHSTVLQELVTHALFIHTWWTGTATSINGVLWTVAIEVQFYALFPLLWLAFKRWPWVTGIALMAFSCVLRVISSRYFSTPVADFLDGNLPNFIDLFASGMLCAWCIVRLNKPARHSRSGVLMPALATTGAILIIAVALAFANRPAWPHTFSHEILGPAFGLLALGGIGSRSWGAALSNPFLRFIAIISYNFYLYNWMIMHQVNRFSPTEFTIYAIVLSIGVATLVTYLLERPLLRLPVPRRWSDIGRSVRSEG